MLINSDINGIKINAYEFWKVKVRINFSGIYDNKLTVNNGGQIITPKENFTEIIRIFNFANFRFSYYKIRIKTNVRDKRVHQTSECTTLAK